MKALKYIIYGLVIVGAGALLAYQGLVEKNLESSDLIRGLLIIAAALIGMFKPNRRTVSNKKVVYQKAYAEHIQGAFEGDAKLEKVFYNAIHLYNCEKPAAALAKLEKLRKECSRSADIRAVTVFMALCSDDMGLYEQSIGYYEAAVALRPNSSLYSNMGLCYQRLGNMEAAVTQYQLAISLDPKNAFAYNNLSATYFRQAEYEKSLEYAKKAIEADNNMPQALSTASICCGLLGDEEGYQKYYRLAVANGYDGRRIKATVQRMKEEAFEEEWYGEPEED